MSEPKPEQQQEPHGTEQQQQSQQQQQGQDDEREQSHDEQRADIDWPAEARKWEKRAKENKDAADKLAKLEQSQMTEQQRLERERDDARETADKSTAELIRMRAAVKHGLSEDDFDLLGTGTEDEVDARAKRVAELRGTTTKKQPATRRPNERLSGGTEPEREPEETDVSKIGARMFRH